MLNQISVPQKLLDFIEKGNKFLVAGHKDPDGDSVGSQLALSSALQRIGKVAIPCSAGPFKRSELVEYKDRFVTILNENDIKDSYAIVVDCSSLSRTGNIEKYLEALPIVSIDHHILTHKDDIAFCFNHKSPSTTCMILKVMEALGLEPTKEEAELLLFGLCSDTGFFRHIDENEPMAFEYAEKLTCFGASPKRIFSKMHGEKTLGSRYLIGIQLSRVKSYFEGKLLMTTEEYEETEHFAKEGRDFDALYQLLQTIKDAEAIVVIRQETPENCTVAFRSKDSINVASIAEIFGGGGHKNAAGAGIAGTIETLYPQILSAFTDIFSHKIQ